MKHTENNLSPLDKNKIIQEGIFDKNGNPINCVVTLSVSNKAPNGVVVTKIVAIEASSIKIENKSNSYETIYEISCNATFLKFAKQDKIIKAVADDFITVTKRVYYEPDCSMAKLVRILSDSFSNGTTVFQLL